MLIVYKLHYVKLAFVPSSALLLEESVEAFIIHYIMAAIFLLYQSRITTEVVSKCLAVYIHHSRLICNNTMESLPQFHTVVAGQYLFNVNAYVLIDAICLRLSQVS